MREAVEERAGEPLGAEHGRPLIERQIARDQRAASLVALAEDLEQQFGPSRRERHHKRVATVVALSGGYTRADACKRLAANHGMIASFSRALAEDLRYSMSDAAFDAALAKSMDDIYRASTVKV